MPRELVEFPLQPAGGGHCNLLSAFLAVVVLAAFTAVVGHGVEVGFGDVGGLLDSLLDRFQGVVAGGNGALEHGDGGFAAGGCVLGGVVHDGQELLLGVGGLAFESLAELGAGAGSDVVQVTAVSGGLLGQGLEQGGLQGQQLLRVLDGSGGIGWCRRLRPGRPWRRSGSARRASRRLRKPWWSGRRGFRRWLFARPGLVQRST